MSKIGNVSQLFIIMLITVHFTGTFTPNTILLHILQLLKNCWFNYKQNWKSKYTLCGNFNDYHLLHKSKKKKKL